MQAHNYKTSLCYSKSSLWNMEYVARGGAFECQRIYRTSTYTCDGKASENLVMVLDGCGAGHVHWHTPLINKVANNTHVLNVPPVNT